MCCNGGDLWLCDRCSRVVCSRHFPVPNGVDLVNTIFLCIACHLSIFTKPVPYFVSLIFVLYLDAGCIFIMLLGILQR